MNKFACSSSKDALHQIWLKLAQWFCRRWFWKHPTLFSLLKKSLPFEEEMTHHLKKNWDPFLQGCFVSSFKWFWKRWKYEKFITTTTPTTTENGQNLIRKRSLSRTFGSGELTIAENYNSSDKESFFEKIRWTIFEYIITVLQALLYMITFDRIWLPYSTKMVCLLKNVFIPYLLCTHPRSCTRGTVTIGHNKQCLLAVMLTVWSYGDFKSHFA